MALPYIAHAEDPVYFADPNLKACVETTLGIPDPNATDMQGLFLLSCASKGITDLMGLEYATNLSNLNLRNNQISDLSPLAPLTYLDELNLPDNQISDLSPLAGLTNLTRLYLQYNQISDISLSPLAGLTSLTVLSLYSNQISDISPLAGLTNLTHLYLELDQIVNISALAGLTNLTVLYLHSNDINDLSPLAGLSYLSELYLHNNQISDISPLAGLTSLTVLSLYSNKISDISPLAGLTSLTRLYLYSNQISDISSLAGLTNLTRLYLPLNPLNNEAHCSDGDLQTIYDKNPGIEIIYSHNSNPPESVLASNGTYTDKVRITWDPICNVYVYGVSGPTYYRVYRSESEGGTKTALGAEQTSTSYDDTTATAGTPYYYWVKAKTQNSDGTYGETDYSSYDIGWIPAPIEKPTVTTLPATDIDCTSAKLWGQIEDDGGEPCQYRFRYKKEGDYYSYTGWEGSVTTGQSFNRSISGLDPNSTYCFNAQATNSAGNSVWGNEQCFQTPDRIQAGTDYWATPDAQIQFGDVNIPEIPADFFGLGSDPFDGLVLFRGEPIEPNESLADTIIERLEDAVLKDPPDPIEIEMVDLNLVSTSPIIVTYDNGTGGESFFDVYMTIDPNNPSIGQMTIDGDVYGGTFWFDINTNIKFIFVSAGGGQEFSLVQPVTMTSEGSYPWQNLPPIIVVRPPCIDSDFYPSGDDELTLQIGSGDSFQNITYKDPLPMDFDEDGDVDFSDFAIFAQRWLVGK